MSDYSKVSDALAEGADPEMLCMTCPWDRFCITPPKMTRSEIEQAKDKAKQDDEAAAAKAKSEGRGAGGLPVGVLISTLMFAGKDTAADMCPVLALRMRSEEGAELVATIRRQMRREVQA